MIDHGDGTYTIKNKKTGEERRVRFDELSKYGLSPKGINRVDKSKTGAFENVIGSTGLYDVPITGGIARALQHQPLKGAEAVAEGVLSPAIDLLTEGKLTNKRRFMSPEAYEKSTGSFGEATIQGLKTGAGSAAYAVPGGGLVGGVTIPGLAAAGGMSAFAETPNTVGETLGGTALGTVLGPLLAKIPGLTGKGTQAIYETVTNKIPLGIREGVSIGQKQLKALEESKLSQMVGYKNRELAKKIGVAVADMPEDVISKVTPVMETIGEKLNQVLTQEYANTTRKEIREALIKAQKQVTPGVQEVDLKNFSNRIDTFLQQNIADTLGPVFNTSKKGQLPLGIQTRTPTSPQEEELTPIPLNVANSIKIRLGERFGDDPLYKQAYKNLQEIIERRSGSPNIIKSLNQQYNALREIKDNANKRIEQGLTSVLENYDIKRQQIKNRPVIDSELAAATGLGAMGAASFGPVGALPGGVWMLYRVLSNVLKNPEYASKLAGVMESPRKLTERGAGQFAKSGVKGVGKVLEQLGVRLPATFYQQEP